MSRGQGGSGTAVGTRLDAIDTMAQPGHRERIDLAMTEPIPRHVALYAWGTGGGGREPADAS